MSVALHQDLLEIVCTHGSVTRIPFQTSNASLGGFLTGIEVFALGFTATLVLASITFLGAEHTMGCSSGVAGHTFRTCAWSLCPRGLSNHQLAMPL